MDFNTGCRLEVVGVVRQRRGRLLGCSVFFLMRRFVKVAAFGEFITKRSSNENAFPGQAMPERV